MYITPINNAMKQNKQEFRGKVYPKQTLDKYLDLLGEYRNSGNNLQRKMQVATEATKIKLEETNEFIKPLINDDEEFLWTITSAKTKDKFAKVVTEQNLQDDTRPVRYTWDKVIEMIRKRILTERPDTLLKEFKETEPYITESAHTNKLKNLKGLLKRKQNHLNNLEDRKEDFAMSHYDKISEIEQRINKIEPRSIQKIKIFIREMYHLAVEKQPELKQIYKKGYIKHFNAHKNDQIKLGQLKQNASMAGHFSVQSQLKYGSSNNNSIPF